MKRIPLIAGCLILFVVGLCIGRIRSVSYNTLDFLGIGNAPKSSSANTLRGPTLFERLDREIAIETQSSYDEGIAFPPMNDTFTTFDKGWEISDKLADVLNLNAGKRAEAQEIISEFRQKIENLVAENTERVDGMEAQEADTVTYRVRPFMNSGHSELETLRNKLQSVFGDGTGEELFKYVRWRPHMGAYGANEVEIKFHKNQEGENARVWFTRRKSMTGETISSYSTDEDKLLDQQGFSSSIFEKHSK